MTSPNIGDSVFLKQLLLNAKIYGVVTDPNNPNLFAATMEIFQDDGVITVPALVGPQGPAGQPQFALRLQIDDIVSVEDLPQDLTNSEADIGKYWILIAGYDSNGNPLGTNAYIWFGTTYRTMPMGSQGPPGPYPVIVPNVVLIDPEQTSYIQVSGTTADPSWTMYLAVPAGPQGPATSLDQAPDVDMIIPPSTGQVLGFNGKYNASGAAVWQPMDVGTIFPGIYTVPEGVFQSYAGITNSRHTVCTYSVPPQLYPWKPYIHGHLSLQGFSISLTPFQIGAEVRLGDPNTGTVVARGFAQADGSMFLSPHASSNDSPSSAITPQNNLGLVPANHTGATGTLYVNLINEGLATVYDFNAANSQLSVLTIPVGVESPAQFNPQQALSSQVNFSVTAAFPGS
jgi:hypothetical protein